MRKRRVPALAAVLASAVFAGCREERAGSPISGQVTFQGRPLDQRTIEFSPAAGQGTLSGGQITEGRYSIPAERGLEPGLYDVRINSAEGRLSPTDELPGETKVIPKSRIPEQYNSKTVLKADVKESGENKFDFTIP